MIGFSIPVVIRDPAIMQEREIKFDFTLIFRINKAHFFFVIGDTLNHVLIGYPADYNNACNAMNQLKTSIIDEFGVEQKRSSSLEHSSDESIEIYIYTLSSKLSRVIC